MQLTLTCVCAAFAVIGMASVTASTGKAFNNILQVWFENQDYNTITNTVGFKTLQSQGILLTNYNAVVHPSQPNYIAAAGGSNFGINDDDYYNIPANTSSIFDLLEKKGLTWKVYQEDLPSVGFTGYSHANYMRKHNPAASFDSIGLNATRVQNIVPATQFLDDINAGNLANWMFYTPNMLNDGHNTDAVYAGNFLAQFYNSTLSHASLKNTLILLTFDENASSSLRNHVWSLLLGAVPDSLKGTIDNTFYTHYSSLSTVEQNWGLGNLGRNDIVAKVSNVYSFIADRLNYTNVDVPSMLTPLHNVPIRGSLTGKSFNTTRQL